MDARLVMIVMALSTWSAAAAAQPVFRADLAGHATGHLHSGFPIDSMGTEIGAVEALESRARLRLEVGSSGAFELLQLRFRVGGDLGAGTWLGGPTLDGDALPGSERFRGRLTESWAELKIGPWVGLRGGLMLSQWGLGLVANAGDDLFDGRVRERLFERDRTGDQVLRAALFARPFVRSEGSWLRGLVLAAAIDQVESDDTSSADAGDRTHQGIASVRLFIAPDEWFGLYYVYRDQRTASGKTVRAHVIDIAGDVRFRIGSCHDFRLQAEFAGIVGETTLAPSPEHPVHDILQFGGLARLQWSPTHLPMRAELDLGGFSGDGNLDDGRITRFVADRNFQQGMILFPTVLAWHTGRQRISADRPEVLGYPPEDLDRLATDGGVTSAVTLFPKAVWTPTPWLDLYGGLLLAFATEHVMDPYTSRTVGGGMARNAMGRAPTSSVLGMELDLGVRAVLDVPSTDLSLIASTEYGVFVPGGALTGMDPVHAVRFAIAVTGSMSISVDDEEAGE